MSIESLAPPTTPHLDLLLAGSVFCDLIFTDVLLPEPGAEVYAHAFTLTPGGAANRAVAVGKTHLATALGHAAIRHHQSVIYSRADKLFTRLRAARLDNTLDAEMRRITTVGVLILDDFALKPLDATQTSDFYELIVERHRKKSTIWVSNREPAEWLTMTTDALLAQSAVDRLTSGAHHLIVEGPSYRQRQRVGLDTESEIRDAR